MENATKVLMLVGAFLLTIGVISLSFWIYNSNTGTLKTVQEKNDRQTAQMMETDYLVYDGLTVKGSDVIGAISRFGSAEIGIKVETKKNTSGVWYIYSVDNSGNIGAASTETIVKKSNDSKYINPTGSFLGSIVRDENGTITGIVFTQQ